MSLVLSLHWGRTSWCKCSSFHIQEERGGRGDEGEEKEGGVEIKRLGTRQPSKAHRSDPFPTIPAPKVSTNSEANATSWGANLQHKNHLGTFHFQISRAASPEHIIWAPLVSGGSRCFSNKCKVKMSLTPKPGDIGVMGKDVMHLWAGAEGCASQRWP